MSSSSFSDFTAYKSGGAIYAEGKGSNVTISRGNFVRNSVTSDESGSGGAVFVADEVFLNLSESEFYDNFGIMGAALYCCGGNIHSTAFIGGVSGQEVQNTMCSIILPQGRGYCC